MRDVAVFSEHLTDMSTSFIVQPVVGQVQRQHARIALSQRQNITDICVIIRYHLAAIDIDFHRFTQICRRFSQDIKLSENSSKLPRILNPTR